MLDLLIAADYPYKENNKACTANGYNDIHYIEAKASAQAPKT